MDLPYSPLLRLFISFLLVAPWATGADNRPAAGSPELVTDSSTTDDELWIISTRHLCFPEWSDPATYDLDVRRYDQSAGWQNSSLAEFLAGPQRITVVYVHANRWSWSDIIQLGPMIAQSLSSCSEKQTPTRYVIWSWPSDKICRPLRDVREKAARADAEGSFFGWFLSQLPADSSVGLIGYSYGVRIISGGLQLLSGGVLNGHTLPDLPRSDTLRIRAVYLAAALDVCWLYPWGYHGQSLSVIDHMLITYNVCDPALKRFRLTDPCTRPTALGYRGIDASALGAASGRVEQLNVSSLIGRTHDERRYWNSSYILAEICRVVFEDSTPTRLADETPSPVPEEQVLQLERTQAVAPQLEVNQPTSEGATGRRFQRSGRFLARVRR